MKQTTVHIEEADWLAFLAGCKLRKTTGSHLIQVYIKEQLARWQAEAEATARDEDGRTAWQGGGAVYRGEESRHV